MAGKKGFVPGGVYSGATGYRTYYWRCVKRTPKKAWFVSCNGNRSAESGEKPRCFSVKDNGAYEFCFSPSDNTGISSEPLKKDRESMIEDLLSDVHWY